MKILAIMIMSLLVSCSGQQHRSSHRQIASVTPVIKRVVQAIAKATKQSDDVVMKKWHRYLKTSGDDLGLDEAMIKRIRSGKTIPADMQKTLEYEFLTRAPRIFNLYKKQSDNILSEIKKMKDIKVSSLQERLYIGNIKTKTKGLRALRGKTFEKKRILRTYPQELRAGMGKTYDNLMKNATTAQERSLVRQIMQHDAEIYLKTGQTALMVNACKKLSGLDVHRTLSGILSDVDDFLLKYPKASKDEVYEVWLSSHSYRTNNTKQASKRAFCILSGGRKPANVKCSTFRPAFFGGTHCP